MYTKLFNRNRIYPSLLCSTWYDGLKHSGKENFRRLQNIKIT